MCEKANGPGPRIAVRFAFVGLAATLLAGCADSSRLMGDPLGNPFRSAQAGPAPAAAPDRDMPPPSYAPRSPVSSRPLPPPSGLPSRNVASVAPPQHVASYEAPVHESPTLSSSYRAPRTERTGSIPAASGHGSWSGDNGSTVIAATGETASVLGQRYNVPTDVLLRVNGFSSGGDVRPGTRVVIPVYSAAGAAAPSHAEPSHAEPSHVEPARVAAEPEPRVRKAAARGPSTRRESVAAHEEAARHDQAVRREQAARREEGLKREQAARHEAAKREQMAKAPQPPMRWTKGPAGKVAEAPVPHGREKAMAKLKPAEAVQVADARPDVHPDARALRKAAKEQALQDQADKQQQIKAAKVDAVPEKPVKMAKVEEPVRSTPPVDPTPTASLPPASEKVGANGGNPEFRWPAHGRIIQGFKSGGNDGINIAVPEGTSVKAAESGVVAYAGNEIKGFGNLVLIRHPNGYVSAYANNANIEVHRGEQVARGQTIAKSGQSGNVASPQLHFELRKGSTPVDPTRYLAGL